MKLFKVVLNTVGKDNEKVIFIIPPADDNDENGNPVYDEDYLLNNAEYKSYVHITKAAVVSVKYILYEADDKTKLNYDELLSSESNFIKIDENDYLIEVKKAKPKSSSEKKTSPVLYVVIAVAIIAVIALMAMGGTKGGKDKPSQTKETSSIPVELTVQSENEAPTDNTAETVLPDNTAETEAENNNTEITSSVISSNSSQAEPVASTTAEKVTLTLDKNGGAGNPIVTEYASGTVVDLPFTEVSRIGYNLIGWATAPTEPYTLYDNEGSKYVMPSTASTLYAIWTAAEYEVTYNYKINGTAVTSKERCKYGELIQLMDLKNVTSGVGDFIGWGLLPDEKEPVQSLTMPDGGIELYAIYK